MGWDSRLGFHCLEGCPAACCGVPPGGAGGGTPLPASGVNAPLAEPRSVLSALELHPSALSTGRVYCPRTLARQRRIAGPLESVLAKEMDDSLDGLRQSCYNGHRKNKHVQGHTFPKTNHLDRVKRNPFAPTSGKEKPVHMYIQSLTASWRETISS